MPIFIFFMRTCNFAIFDQFLKSTKFIQSRDFQPKRVLGKVLSEKNLWIFFGHAVDYAALMKSITCGNVVSSARDCRYQTVGGSKFICGAMGHILYRLKNTYL